MSTGAKIEVELIIRNYAKMATIFSKTIQAFLSQLNNNHPLLCIKIKFESYNWFYGAKRSLTNISNSHLIAKKIEANKDKFININKLIQVSKMKCSICKEEGHNKRSCKKITTSVSSPKIESETSVKIIEPVKEEMVLKTEDTGKIFEMAICLAYGITYDGKFKYSMEIAEKLKERLSKLVEIFPMCRHSAKKGSRYDYTSLTDETKHLSAKSTKKGVGKVAPQVVGQSQPTKFCEIIGIEYTTIPTLKQYIQTDIVKIIPILVGYTFDCPNIYYNQEKNTIRYITLNTPIEWSKYSFKWTCDWTEWSNSSTLKIIIDETETALLEFQFHTKSRTNMAIRWCYENFLTIFKDNLSIIDI